MLDDTANLAGARAGKDLVGTLDAIFSNRSSLIGRPLSLFTFYANFALFGDSATSFKITNVALHWMAACAALSMLGRILRLQRPEAQRSHRSEFWCAALATALWILHPLQVSTVLYVVQRMTILAAIFMLISVSAFARLLEIRSPTRNDALKVFAVCSSLAGVALLCKETAVLTPLLISVVAACNRSAMTARHRAAAWALGYGPSILLALSALAFLPDIEQLYRTRDFSMVDRLLSEAPIIVGYAWKTLVPNITSMGLMLDDVPVRSASDPLVWGSAALIFCALIWALRVRKSSPTLAFAVLWFLACHALESTILPLELAFEHRNYLAIMGPMYAIARGVTGLPRHSRSGNLRLAAAIGGLILLTYGVATASRAHEWSRIDLYVRGEVRNHPLSPRAQSSAAAFERSLGNLDATISRIHEVQRLRPNQFWPFSMDIHVACDVPDYPVDWDHLEQLIQEAPDDAGSLVLLRSIVARFTLNECPGVDPARVQRLLERSAAIFKREGAQEQEERARILLSELALTRGDRIQAIAQLTRGSEANPTGHTALLRLAYLYLNGGNIKSAQQIADKLTTQDLGRDGFKLRELSEQITSATESQRSQ